MYSLAHETFGRPTFISRITRLAGAIGLLILQVLAAFLVWHAVVVYFDVDPRIVPPPMAVLQSLTYMVNSGELLSATMVTLYQTLSGFVIGSALGIFLAILISESRIMRVVIKPYIIAIQAIPKLAMAPLFIIWFGFGMESKIALVVTILFFPVLVNTLTGLQSADADQLDLMRAYRATRLQTLFRLKFFVALPFILAALEVGLVLGLTASVVVEMLGSGTTQGLGTLIKLNEAQMNSAAMFAVLIVMAALGIALHWAIVTVSSNWLKRYK